MKNLLKISVLTVLTMLVFTACAAGTVGAPVNSTEPAQLSVTGTGQVLVVPDVASITVGVQTRGATVSEALEANNAQAQQIKDTLIAAGILEKDVQTSYFNVYQQFEYDLQGNPSDPYFTVDNSVYVTVRDIAKLGEILDTVGRSGANNIYGVNFDVEDKTEAQSTARDLAVQSAKVQAEKLAKSAGVELGELLSVNSSATMTSPIYGGYGMGGGGMAESVPISSGQMPINAQVILVYAIK